MGDNIVRAEDPRTLYTKSMIKSALLELLQTHSYTSISVTMLSERAGIGRNTFYRHFSNTFEALEAAIDDALKEIFAVFKFLGLDESDLLDSYIVPLCEYIKSSRRYKVVFTDTELSPIIIERMLLLDDRRFVRALQAAKALSERQAEAIVRFQVAGILETCNQYANAKDGDWAEIIAGIEKFGLAL